MLARKEMGNHFFLAGSWGSGMVIHMGNIRGSDSNQNILLAQPGPGPPL